MGVCHQGNTSDKMRFFCGIAEQHGQSQYTTAP
jgi:hypothetical protein